MENKQFKSSSTGRLDLVIKNQLPDYSRSFINYLIKNNLVTVNSIITKKPSYHIKKDDILDISIPSPQTPNIIPLSGQLSILYEDENLLVIDKPANLPVHPSPGHQQDTLVNLLIHKYPDLTKQFQPINNVYRPGIVHRLDKDTSGIIIIAKNQPTLNSLQTQIKQKIWIKKYYALVYNPLKQSRGEIQENIIRDPHHRKKFTITTTNQGKTAHTSFQIKKNYSFQKELISLLDILIHTGRTHQIRVHLSNHNLPILGDQIYNSKNSHSISKQLNISRQLLHAYHLEIINPSNQEKIFINTKLPSDFKSVIDELEKNISKDV